jgi:hypothetical protein
MCFCVELDVTNQKICACQSSFNRLTIRFGSVEEQFSSHRNQGSVAIPELSIKPVVAA